MSKSMTWNAPCCSACGAHHNPGGCQGNANPFAPAPLTLNDYIAALPVEDVLDLDAERERYDLVTNEAPTEPDEDVLDLDYERTKYGK